MITKKMTDAQRQVVEDTKQKVRMFGDAINTDLRRHKFSDNAQITDTVPAAIMARALEYAVAQGVMETNTMVTWREVFPIDRDMPKGAKTKIYTIYSGSGMSAWYRAGSKHPNVAIGSREVPIVFNARSAAFTIESLEMMAADYAGVNVEAMKFARVLEGFDNDIEDIMFLGDAAMLYSGLIDHPNITQANLVTGDWDLVATTPALIIADVQAVIAAMVAANGSSRKFRGKKIKFMLSPELYLRVTTTIANTYTNETIETVLLNTNSRFGGFIESPIHGETAGGAGDYISCGVFDDINAICVPMSMDAERMPPDDRGMTIEQPFVSKFAALHVKEPLWFYQAESAHS